MTDQTAEKQAAGRHAASYVEDGMRVGLGTGTTVHWTIDDRVLLPLTLAMRSTNFE